MVTLVCLECGIQFEAKTIRAKRCSDECKKIAARRRATDFYSANGRVGEYGSTDCCICEQHFTRTRWKQKTCSDACRAANQKRLARKWYDENTELANRRSSDWSRANYDYEPAQLRREERQRTAPARRAQRKQYQRIKSKQWRERNKERAAELKITAKLRNPEKYRETHRRWREANKERRAELNRRWAEANPDKVAAGKRKARMQRRNARQGTAYLDSEVFAADNWICYLCEKPIDAGAARKTAWGAQIEHLVPISRGGLDCRDNVRAAHRRCNFKKRSKLVSELTLPFPGPSVDEIDAFLRLERAID